MILVKSAMYGRMRPGRCVQQNYGYIGCHTDVTRVIATRCSGRSRCEIANLEAELATYQNCPADLKVYLDANYTCIKGRHGTARHAPIRSNPTCPASTRLILHQLVPSSNVSSSTLSKSIRSTLIRFILTRTTPIPIKPRAGKHINNINCVGTIYLLEGPSRSVNTIPVSRALVS